MILMGGAVAEPQLSEPQLCQIVSLPFSVNVNYYFLMRK